MIRIAHGYDDVAGPDFGGLGGEVLLHIQVELLHVLGVRGGVAAVVFFGELKHDEEHHRKARSRYGGHLLGEHVDDGEREQHYGDEHQDHGDFSAADMEVQRHFPFAAQRLLIAQHQDRQGLHREAPHHAEGVGFTQHVHVAAADQDGDQLQDHDDVDDPRSGAELVMRVAEPVREHTVLGHAVEHAVGADDGGVD